LVFTGLRLFIVFVSPDLKFKFHRFSLHCFFNASHRSLKAILTAAIPTIIIPIIGIAIDRGGIAHLMSR